MPLPKAADADRMPAEADLGAAPVFRLTTAPWPEDCDNLSSAAFFEVLADGCRRDHPDLANRFERFADAFRLPAERARLRLAQRDDLIRRVAAEHYPRSLGCNGRARMISEHLAQMNSARLPPGRPQNQRLREILELNEGRPVGFEALRKVLRT